MNFRVTFGKQQWQSQPDFSLLLCKFQLLVIIISLFISLEIDCFYRPLTSKIHIAGVNSRASFATGKQAHLLDITRKIYWFFFSVNNFIITIF